VIGESPLWRDGGLCWTDPVERHLLRAAGKGLQTISVSRSIWSLAALPDGTMVGSLDDGLARIADDGSILAGPAAAVPAGCRFNDMTAGADGALWVGAMHRGILASTGAIFRADSVEAEPRQVASGLGVPNGMKLSADGGTLFAVDTLQRTLLAYPVVGTGLGEPIIVTDFLGVPGKPDGMALAADGAFWVAMWGGACVVEIAPYGAILRQVAIPAPHVSSVCLAPDGRLLVSTSRMRLSPLMLERYPQSGGLFEIWLGEDS
jgi:sugar lactone lactonase YvrE